MRIKGFAALREYDTHHVFRKRYLLATVVVSYPHEPPREIIQQLVPRMDRMYDYYIGSCVGVAHQIRAELDKADPFHPDKTLEAIQNIFTEHKRDVAMFATMTHLPPQTEIFGRQEAEGLDQELYHAEVQRATG